MNSSSWTTVGLRKTGAVSRMKSIQNWPGASSTSGFGPSRISRSSKPLASSVPGERLLDDEHDAMATRPQDLADPDAVVGRAEGAFGEEDDGARLVAHLRIMAEPSHVRDAALQGGTPKPPAPRARATPAA